VLLETDHGLLAPAKWWHPGAQDRGGAYPATNWPARASLIKFAAGSTCPASNAEVLVHKASRCMALTIVAHWTDDCPHKPLEHELWKTHDTHILTLLPIPVTNTRCSIRASLPSPPEV
jgi:hypothetical protein